MKIILFDWNGIARDLGERLVQRGHELLPLDGHEATWRKADVIIVWNETDLGGWKDWINEVRAAGKKVILLQHGRRGTSRIYPPFNEKLNSDLIFAWGENDRHRLESCGVEPERICVTSTPIFKHLIPRESHKGINVVFSPEHWDQEVPENAIVASQLSRLTNVKVTTKTLRGQHDPAHYENPIESDRNAPDHLDICAKVLSTADLVVSISESTFELLAQSLDIPVVIADIWIPKACDGDDRYKEYRREYSDACKRVKDIKRLNETIRDQLSYPEDLQEERASIVLLDGGTYISDPLATMVREIEAL